MKKYFLLLSLFLFPIYAFSQHCKMRLFLSSGELANENDALEIKNIRFVICNDSIVVETLERGVHHYSESAVWGYKDRYCEIYRNFEQRLFKVEANDSLIMYSVNSYGYKGVPLTNYFFSKNLSSPIFSFKWKNIKEEFKDNECFLGKLENLKWHKSYSDWDKNSKSFTFIKLFNECKTNPTR